MKNLNPTVKQALKDEVTIPLADVDLEGIFTMPDKAEGVVIFAHGAGSSRLSPRNNFVADVLHQASLGTLLFDLLTEEEDEIYANRFDINILTERLIAATGWVKQQPQAIDMPVGYFGASTGSAAALAAAAKLDKQIKAVVSRGGRPDLSENVLDKVSSPTLLIVGELDEYVLDLNKEAFEKIKAEKKIEIVSGATHLFEEPGTLEEVAGLSKEWFKKYL